MEEGGDHEPYDLKGDPDEEHNLYGNPLAKAIQEELTKRLHEWQRRIGDLKVR